MIFNYKILAIIFIFLLGLFYYSNYFKIYEGYSNNSDEKKSSSNLKCPNMLIEKDGKILLFNSNIAIKQDVNPIEFNNLEEYSEFIELQKSQNINCPVLYLQYTTDTQNNDLLQIKPSIFENSGGLPTKKSQTLQNKFSNDYFDENSGEEPTTKSQTLQNRLSNDYFDKNKMLDATLDSTPNSKIKFNTGMFSGYDQYNQNIGATTPLDFLYVEKTEQSRNPMDPNWGGKKYTNTALARGDYKDREVYKYNTP